MVIGYGADAAFHVLNRSLTVLRTQVSYGQEAAETVRVLDRLEYLVRLMASEQDSTEEFRANVVDLASRFAGFHGLERLLDEGASHDW